MRKCTSHFVLAAHCVFGLSGAMTDPVDLEDETCIIAEVHPAPARLAFSLFVQYALALLVLYLAFAHPPELVFQIVLIVIALGFIYLAEQGRRVKGMVIYLSRQRLWDSKGREIAKLDQIKSVDRGALAFKPSNGFLLRLDSAPGHVWVPGLWWRLGRSIGVGGVTPAGATKFMGEMIATLLNERDIQRANED